MTVVSYSLSGELGFDDIEFEFISRYMASPKQLYPWSVDNLKAYIKYIAEIRKELIYHNHIQFSNYSESEYFGLAKINTHLNCFQYSYQRYDLISVMEDWLNQIYNIQNDNFISSGLFLTSGMSALLVTLLSLNHLYPKHSQICISKYGYFEINTLLTKSIDFLKVNYFEEKNFGVSNIVIIDSSAPILPKKEEWIAANVIIIDTTCWEIGSQTLKDLLDSLQDHQGIIILIRSHIKLDCFGLEINRLGSIVVLSPSNRTIKNNFDIKIFQKTCEEINGNIGSNFHLHDYYPWLLEEKFYELSSRRTARIRFYTDLIYNILISAEIPAVEIIKTQHNLFILIKLLHNKISDPIIKYAQEVCSIANQLNVAIVPAPSFALCCTTFDGYRSKIDNEVYLRIAPSPNMSLNHANKIAYFLIDLFSQGVFYHDNYKKENFTLHNQL